MVGLLERVHLRPLPSVPCGPGAGWCHAWTKSIGAMGPVLLGAMWAPRPLAPREPTAAWCHAGARSMPWACGVHWRHVGLLRLGGMRVPGPCRGHACVCQRAREDTRAMWALRCLAFGECLVIGVPHARVCASGHVLGRQPVGRRRPWPVATGRRAARERALEQSWFASCSLCVCVCALPPWYLRLSLPNHHW